MGLMNDLLSSEVGDEDEVNGIYHLYCLAGGLVFPCAIHLSLSFGLDGLGCL